jgi:hypothetical protein
LLAGQKTWRSKTSETLPRRSSRFPESIGEFVTGTRPKMGRRRSNEQKYNRNLWVMKSQGQKTVWIPSADG